MDNGLRGAVEKKHTSNRIIVIVRKKNRNSRRNLSTSGADVPTYYMFYDYLSIYKTNGGKIVKNKNKNKNIIRLPTT